MENFESLYPKLVTVSSFLSWVLTGIVLNTLRLRLSAIWEARRWNREIPYRRVVDISHLNTPLPDTLRPAIAELQALGFRRLGESQVESPEQMPLGKAWVFVNAEGTVFVEVIAVGQLSPCGFTTTFVDGTVTQVFYPQGESIEDPDFVQHRNNVSIKDAYRQQLEQITTLYATHGAPRSIRTMPDCLDVSALYRERYEQRLMDTKLRTKYLGPLVIDLVVAVLMAGLLIGEYVSHWSPLLVFGAMVVIVAPYFKWVLSH
jgi:hypothetical protein